MATSRTQKLIYENRNTLYEYDSHNRLILKTNADLTTCQYGYDVADNLTAKFRENMELITYAYDDADRLTLTEYRTDITLVNPPEIADERAYNGLDALVFTGELLNTQDTLGGFKFQESYLYESRGLLLECTQTIGTFSPKTFSKDYDAVGNLLSVEYPGTREVKYLDYTDIELLGRVTTQGFDDTMNPGVEKALVEYTYNGYGRINTRSVGNDFDLEVEYDAVKRIESYLHRNNNDSLIHIGFNETYDQVDNRRSETLVNEVSSFPSGAQIWEYDNYYRTTGFIRALPDGLVTQALNDFSTITASDGLDFELNAYDLANNITQTTKGTQVFTVSNNEMNETESIGSFRTNIQYDPLGRMTFYEETLNNQTTFFKLTYNQRDQLIQVESSPDNIDFSIIATYQYYSSGMRAIKEVPGLGLKETFYGPQMTIHEIYEVDQSDEETRGPVKEFIFESIDRPIVMFHNVDGDDQTGALAGREAYFYHENPKGDIFALSNESGEFVERYAYTLYGVTLVMDGQGNPITGSGFQGIVGPPVNIGTGMNPENISRFGNPFQFAGTYKDNETDFNQMRWRYYDPHLAGFITRDPLEDDSLKNLYAYVENRPGTLIDPWGLSPKMMGNYGLKDTLDEYSWKGFPHFALELKQSVSEGFETTSQAVADHFDKMLDNLLSDEPLLPPPGAEMDFEQLLHAFGNTFGQAYGGGALKFGAGFFKATKFFPVKSIKYFQKFQLKPSLLKSGLKDSTPSMVKEAFKGTDFILSGHFIKRVRDVRTSNLGLKTFKDLQAIFRKGNVVDSGNGLKSIQHGSFEIIYNPKAKILVTLKPR